VWAAIFAVLTVAVLALAPSVRRLVRAEHMLARLSSPAAAVPQRAEDLVLVTAGGPLHARLYGASNNGERKPAVVVAHGIHRAGIDEPRLTAFARSLADAGLVVLTPELEDLADYRVTSRSRDEIAESVRYLAGREDVVLGDRVGLLGFSFAGGLSLLAAGDPDIGAHLSWVASVGGYQDLARVLRFFAEDRIETPEGTIERRAHEYGLVVLVYGSLDWFVPDSDREPVRGALRAWIHEKRDTARSLATRRTSLAGEELFTLLDSHRLSELGPRIERLIENRRAELDALSPRGKLGRITVPVYLLHGAGDTVIPPSETEWGDRELGAQPHLALVSPLLEHVELAHQSTVREKIALLRFVAQLL
jgi:dienelactone hydrolase